MTARKGPFGAVHALVREIADLIDAVSRFLPARHKRGLLAVSIWACAVSLLEMGVAGAIVAYAQCLSAGCAPAVARGAALTGLSLVPAISLGLFALIAIKLAVQAGFQWRQVRFVQGVQRDTLTRLLEGYFRLDWPVFRARNNAHYFRRCATTAIDAAHVSHQCATLISAGLMVAFLAALTVWLYPLMSLALGAGFVLLAVLMQVGLGRAQKRAAHAREAALQRFHIGMAEAFSSFREIRVYGLERFFEHGLGEAIGQLAATNRRLDFYPALPRIVMDFAISGTVLLVVAAWLTLDRPVRDLLPMLIFFAVVARSVLPAMMTLLSIRAQLYGSIVNIELVLEEFARNAEGRRENVGVDPQAAARAAFALRDVRFRHARDLPLVLDGASIEIAHPSWVALTGPSGTGKTTLMELLCGIQRPESGAVVHAWPAAGEAPRIAYVPQHVTLLDGTVMDNVVFGFDAGDRERARVALGHAGLFEAVEKLDGGLDARVGAEGSRLSGGERQRLALARALYRRPDLILLDEATSGLDEATESRVLAAMRHAYPDMSLVYITHRKANLRFADAVARLDNGKITVPAGDGDDR